MVTIENITREAEERKLKVYGVETLAEKFFEKPSVYSIGDGIVVELHKEPSYHLGISLSSNQMRLSLPESLIPNYTEKTIKFAEAYEQRFRVNVVLKTDYSKKD